MRFINGVCTVIICLIGISMSAPISKPQEQDFPGLYVHEDVDPGPGFGL